jgi:hypothetical protein
LLLVAGCSDSPGPAPGVSEKKEPQGTEAVTPKKKVLFVNSYHQGYDWSDGITRGITDTLNVNVKGSGELDNSESAVILKIIYLDTKRNKTEEFKREAAIKAVEVIESWQPDLVITSDDNAAKYLVVPYYKKSSLPFVFCAVNLDASPYGFPNENITGIVEVTLIKQMLKELRKYAKGDRIGLLGADSLTRRKSAAIYRSHYKLDIDNRYAATFEEWQREFIRLQDEVDMLLITSPAGISGWDHQEAVKFVQKHTKIPSGCNIYSAMPFSLIGYTKIPEEQGEWAAKTALEILGGKSPKDFPVATNEKAKIYLNMRLARKLDIVFPITLIEQANFVAQEKRE